MARPFDANSAKLLEDLDPRLATILRLAHDETPFDWRIVQTKRTIEEQRALFHAVPPRTKVDPDAYDSLAALYRAAKHITGPGMPLSRAADVAIVGRDPYHIPSLTWIAATVALIAKQRGVDVRWGGDFDQDGLLLEPGTFHDLPHHEVV